MAEGGAAATVVAETAVRAAEVREVCCCFGVPSNAIPNV